jgi:hypothetical protein
MVYFYCTTFQDVEVNLAKKRRSKLDLALPGKGSTPSQRVVWLLNAVWNGNRSEMARAIGVGQSVISKIAGGEQSPGRRLLQAISEHPKVNPGWVLSGEGAPLLAESGQSAADGWPVRIATQLLPGPLDEHRSMLSDDSFFVAGAQYRPSRYFYRVGARDPIAAARRSHIAEGDLLLLDSDREAWNERDRCDGHICVVTLPGRTNPELASIEWRLENYPEPAFLDAVTFDEPIPKDELVEQFTILKYPDGKLDARRQLLRQTAQKQARGGLRAVRDFEETAFLKPIATKDILALCVLVIRHQFHLRL